MLMYDCILSRISSTIVVWDAYVDPYELMPPSYTKLPIMRKNKRYSKLWLYCLDAKLGCLTAILSRISSTIAVWDASVDPYELMSPTYTKLPITRKKKRCSKFFDFIIGMLNVDERLNIHTGLFPWLPYCMLPYSNSDATFFYRTLYYEKKTKIYSKLCLLCLVWMLIVDVWLYIFIRDFSTIALQDDSADMYKFWCHLLLQSFTLWERAKYIPICNFIVGC